MDRKLDHEYINPLMDLELIGERRPIEGMFSSPPSCLLPSSSSLLHTVYHDALPHHSPTEMGPAMMD
jgi:hypothetical protein